MKEATLAQIISTNPSFATFDAQEQEELIEYCDQETKHISERDLTELFN